MSSKIPQGKIENSQMKMEGRLGFFGLIKESLNIQLKNPNFIIFSFFASVPLFCSMCLYEIVFQQTLIETGKIIQETITPPSKSPYEDFNYDYAELMNFERWIGKVSHKFLLLVLLYLGILYFIDFFNTIAIVDVASMIYKDEEPMNLHHMFSRFINETRFKGPLITSIYVLLLASLISFGLVPLAAYVLIYTELYFVFFTIISLVIFVALLAKYIEWSAVWNLGIVISVLEERQGDEALVVAVYLSRGRKLCGFVLMLVLFAWRLGLRLSCLYAGWKTGGGEVIGTILHIGLVCLANVLKWVIFVVFFYDCKKHSSVKKVDAEEVS
ncbi:hypothetical protein P3X46_026035 [Hevea brasiliensis]|uniref:Transmembrane protein n=2 Tax=Hevea brasiliensis TaxID=3981 RepID=A0ABQ9KWT8_HEVBR|nr:hypothetical protein P3X46_026035 [Hevea brasiliensis]